MPTLDFKGKQFIYTHHLSVPFRTLEVDPKKSLQAKGAKPSLDDNLIIHGDNLHALKALLPTHAGKIDCIYIDPPYNTGNESWKYNDAVNSPLMQEWLKANGPVDKEDLERHDKWLCMMWPRLRLLRELLADDGAIFISIDDNEMPRLRDLMDECFGEAGFIASITWRKKVSPSNDADYFSNDHEYILVYAKQAGSWAINRLEMNERQRGYYSNPDNDPRGDWNSATYTCNKSKSERPNLYYPIKNPNTGKEIWPKETAVWAYNKAANQLHSADERLYWGANGKAAYPRLKKFLSGSDRVVPRSVWDYTDVGSTQSATQELAEIFDSQRSFPTPKPSTLIKRVLELATNRNSIILDSFAGSGATAHAVLRLNELDGGDRRFILVECEDYANELTAERVRRVIKGYKFAGIKREELWSHSLTYTALKRSGELLEKTDSFDMLDGHRFDKITKTVDGGVLKVTGEKKITGKTEGLGGSFTYCELGPEINVDGMLTGKKLPDYASLARYVFYTATGRTLEKDVSEPRKDWLIGETEMHRLYLIYKPDKEWLRSNEAALNATTAAAIQKSNKSKTRCLVFAAVKFIGQKALTTQYDIEFCQLPYAIHRILGD